MPGGRDIDPKKYNQENKGSSKVTVQKYNRYDFNAEAFDKLPRKLPIFGICWGLQFINVYFGGDLVQDMENSKEHFKKRRISLMEGSIIHGIVGSEMLGQCYHHQSVGKIGKGVKVTGIDDFSKEPHVLEYTENERWILSVLWHPEGTYTDESRTVLIDKSILLLKVFIEKCKAFKDSKKKAK
jgi:putative glutamine amidotransferase